MSSGLKRRHWLGGVFAAGTAIVAPVCAAPADARLEALIDLSRDDRGVAHIDRAAFIDADGHGSGNLRLSADEVQRLRQQMDAAALADFVRDGVRIDGRRFVFVRSDQGGALIQAVRRGEFVTICAAGGHLIVASSRPRQAHARAVCAVATYAERGRYRPASSAPARTSSAAPDSASSASTTRRNASGLMPA